MAVRVKERPIRQYDDHVARLNFPGSMEGQKSPTDKFAKECRRQKAVPLVAIYAARNQDGGHFFGCEADIENLMLVGSDVDNLADNLAAYLLCAVCGRRDLAHDLIDMVYEAQNRNAVENGYEDLAEWSEHEIDEYDKAQLEKAKAILDRRMAERRDRKYIKELNRKAISKRKEKKEE